MPRFDTIARFQGIPVSKFVLEQVTSDPATDLVEGRVIYRTDIKVAKIYENSAWVVLDSSLSVPSSRTITAGTGLTGGGDLSANRTLAADFGTGAGKVTQGNDSRLTDSRTPTGSAGGALTGTYPNPTLATNAVTAATQISSGIITDTQIAAANKDGASGTASMRTIGTGATQAMAGNTTLSSIAAPTGSVSFNSQRITGLADPTGPQDAATKNYVDLARQGIRLKDAVRVATTANITLSGTQTIDSVAVVAGNRVLVKNQSTAANNGIYVVAAGAWTRAEDADTAAEVNDGATVFVQEGGQDATTWAQTLAVTTLGTSSQNWAQQGAAAAYTAGNGLDLTGSDFSVNVDASTIEINSDTLRVKDLGITNAKIANSTISLTAKVTGILPVANGGTNSSTAAGARTSLGAAGYYSTTSPALSTGSWSASINHALNSWVMVQCFEVSSGELVELDIKRVDANNVQIKTDLPAGYSAAAFQVVCVGA